MMARYYLLVCIYFISLTVNSQNNADEILGYYMSSQQNSIFKFYKDGEKYYAKSVWMKHPGRRDTLNPDVTKRNRKILGSILVWDFVHDGPHTWINGYVYDANKGKTYKSIITRDKDGNLLVRGYIGISIIGKTEYFVKVNYKE